MYKIAAKFVTLDYWDNTLVELFMGLLRMRYISCSIFYWTLLKNFITKILK